MSDEAAVRLRNIRQALKGGRLDALMVFSPYNVAYMAGVADAAWALVSRNLACVMPSRLSSYSIRRGISRHWRALDWRESRKALRRLALRERLGRIGVEAPALTLARRDALAHDLRGASLILPAQGLVERSRTVKSAVELETMRKAGKISAEVARQIPYILRAGMREIELAREIDNRIRNLGADGPAFDTIVLAGTRTVHPHGRPGDRKFRRGDLCLTDFGAGLNGYRSDITRTYCVGCPASLQRARYAAVRRAYLAARARARSGAKCRALDAAARGSLGRLESRFIHGLGHGVGLEIHEAPSLAAASSDRLRSGMVVTIEPGLYYPGWGAIRLEDTFAIDRGGARSLTGELPAELPVARAG